MGKSKEPRPAVNKTIDTGDNNIFHRQPNVLRRPDFQGSTEDGELLERKSAPLADKDLSETTNKLIPQRAWVVQPDMGNEQPLTPGLRQPVWSNSDDGEQFENAESNIEWLPPDQLHAGMTASEKYGPPLKVVSPPQIPDDQHLSLPPEQNDIHAPGNLSNLSRRPRFIGERPILTPLETQQEDLRQLQTSALTDENGRLKSALIGAGQGLSQAFQTPVRNWNDFAGRLGGGIGGAVGGALRPKFDEEQQRQINIAKKQGQIGQLEIALDNQLSRAAKESQIDEIRRRPQKEQEAFRQKVEMEAARQADRISAIFARDQLKNKDYTIEVVPGGRLIKKYPDREVPYTDPDTGEQLYDPYERSYDYITSEGTPVKVKGRELIPLDNAKAFYNNLGTTYSGPGNPQPGTIPPPSAGGKPSPVSEQLYRERLIRLGVKDPATQNILVKKGQADGVIR